MTDRTRTHSESRKTSRAPGRWPLCALIALLALSAQAAFAADPPRRTSARPDRQREDRQREDGDDDSRPDPGPSGSRKATLAVTGPVRLRLNLHSGRISVRGTDRQQVDAAVTGSSSGGVRLSLAGDRVEVVFPGQGRPRDARVRLEVPRGTAVELETLSADVEVEGTGADVRVNTLSGDVRVSGVAAATLTTVSGDLEVEGAKGPVRVHTVSGEAEVSQGGAGNASLEFESTSGDLRWAGACGPGCRLDAQTLSGNVRLALAPQSGFELSFSTRSGEVHDGFGLAAGAPKRRRRHGLEAKAGGGEGRIECDTFSGDLELARTGK